MIRRAAIAALLAALAVPGAARAQCSTSGAVSICLTPPSSVTGTVLLQPTSTAGNPSRVTYTLDGAHLLIAFDPPYAFRWPTARYAQGGHTLGVTATAGAVTTPLLTFPVTISNPGSPPKPGVFQHRPGTTPPPGRPFTLAAGGDGASGESSSTVVTNEIASWSPNMMLYLGDVYDDGTIAEFYNWYGEATHQWFDRFKSITNPVIGNHEYDPVLSNRGYVGYWGTGSDVGYSYDVAGWHLIALNSNTQIGPAGITKEVAWLQQDLAKTPASRCTLAYFHHPMQNSGPEGEPIANSLTTKLWAALLGKADVVLNGHDHDYQRYKPVSGVTEFVVGTTGHSRQAPQPDPRLASFFGDVFGALRAELNPHGFSYRFIDDSGAVLDSGVIPCAGAHDTAAPAAPTGLTTAAISRSTVDLRWQTPRDDVGVTGYDVIRNGVVIGTTAGATRFVDASVQAGTAYRYAIRARDGAGHIGTPSATITVLPSSLSFLDSFESANLAAWTARGGPVAVTTAAARVGRFGLRVAPSQTPAYVSKTLVTPFTTLETLMRVRINSRSTQANLVTFTNSAGQRIVTAFSRNTTGNVCFVAGAVTTAHCGAATRIDGGQWHTLRVTVTTGGLSRVRILLDEHLVLDDSTTALGATKIGRLVLGTGATTNGETYNADFDLVAADPLPIGDIVSPTTPAALAARAVSGLRVNLSWRPATDDTRVTGYDVFRNGVPIAITGTAPSFADTSVDGLVSYVYTVRARDAAGNVSPLSAGVAVDTPIVLREAFTSAASLRRFSPSAGLQWNASTHALRLRNGAHGRIALPGATTRLYARLKFRISTRGANRVPLIALRSATGTVMSAGLDAGGHLGRGLPASRQWHDLQVHADVARRLVEVWLDGEQRTELTATLPAGRPPITAIELGGPGVYDMLEDQLEANTRFMTDTVRPSAPRRVTTTVARSRTVTIAWTAAHDDVRVTGYRIFRGSMEIGRTTAGHRRFTDRFAPPSARVVYAVRAFDAAGNLSTARSRAIRVPFLSEPRTRRVRARRVVRLRVPATTHTLTLSLRVRARTTPRRAVVAQLGTTTLRFPRNARRNRFITLRIRVRHPSTTLQLGGRVAFDVRAILIR